MFELLNCISIYKYDRYSCVTSDNGLARMLLGPNGFEYFVRLLFGGIRLAHAYRLERIDDKKNTEGYGRKHVEMNRQTEWNGKHSSLWMRYECSQS